MKKLSFAISKVIVNEYGQHEFLRRLADPLWFQAFGCVLGFDWHSSGVTTVVTGVLKQSIKENVHSISIAGGKGKRSLDTKNEIPLLAEKNYNLSSSKIDELLYASKIAAKIDNAALQDGYSLYHHVIFFDEYGNWTIVQQGMNSSNKMARRYHWISENLKSFVTESHAGIISENRNPNTLNMTSIDSNENQKICVDLVNSNIINLQSSVYKVLEITKKNTLNKITTLDNWIVHQIDNTNISAACTMNTKGKYKFNNRVNMKSNSLSEHYEMPRRLDWNIFRKAYDIQPKNYEQLI